MRKFLILVLISILFIGAAACVSAADNSTECLGKTYYYDANADEEYVDDTVVTHNVVKYYGDTDTRFRVKVYDDDYSPAEDVYVKFKRIGETTRLKQQTARG